MWHTRAILWQIEIIVSCKSNHIFAHTAISLIMHGVSIVMIWNNIKTIDVDLWSRFYLHSAKIIKLLISIKQIELWKRTQLIAYTATYPLLQIYPTVLFSDMSLLSLFLFVVLEAHIAQRKNIKFSMIYKR